MYRLIHRLKTPLSLYTVGTAYINIIEIYRRISHTGRSEYFVNRKNKRNDVYRDIFICNPRYFKNSKF